MTIEKTQMNDLLSFIKNDKKNKSRLGLYSKTGKNNFFNIKDDGEYEIRVLAMGTFYSGTHWNVLERGTVRCPRAFAGDECPVCDLAEKLAGSGDKNDAKEADKLKVNVKYPMIVVDLSEPGSPTPRIYEAPKTVFEGIAKYTDKKLGYGNIFSHENGRNFVLVRYKDDNFTKYDVRPAANGSPIDLEGTLIPDLKTVLKPRSYAEIEYALEYGEYPQKSDDEVEAQPDEPKRTATVSTTDKKPTSYGKGLPAPKVQDEEPEQDSVEDDDIEIEQPAPAVRRPLSAPKSAPRAVQPALPAEDEQDDDQEEVEAPKATAPKLGVGGSLKDRLASISRKKA